AGSVSFNRIDNTTEALLDGVAVTTPGDITLFAADTSNMVAIGGGGSYGEKAGLGAAIALSVVDNTTRAAVLGNYQRTTLGDPISRIHDLNVTAVTDNSIWATALSLGAGKQVGAAFTLGINLVINSVQATVSGADLYGTGSVVLLAREDSVIRAVGGALGYGKDKLGFGAALGWNSVTNVVTAAIEDASLLILGDVSVTAESTETSLLLGGKILAATAGAAGSTAYAVGGALSINVIANTVNAHISSGSVVDAQGRVDVRASDTSSIASFTGELAISTGELAAGVSIGANFIGNNVTAFIDGSDVTSDIGRVSVNAVEGTAIYTATAGGVGADKFAFGGAVSINNIVNTTQAYVNNATITAIGAGGAEDKVTVAAVDRSEIDSLAGNGTWGGKFSAGAAIAQNGILNTVRAFVSGSTLDMATSGSSGPLTGSGLEISAISNSVIRTIAAGFAGSKQWALSGSFSENIILNTMEAYIDGGSTVTAGGDISVVAQDFTDDSNIFTRTQIDSLAGTIAGAGKVSAGLAEATNLVINNIGARIGESVVKSEAGDITISALSEAKILSMAAGVAGAGDWALEGALTINDISSVVQASIADPSTSNGSPARVTAFGDITLTSSVNAEIDTLAATIAAAGKYAVGAAGAVNVIANAIGSTISGATVISTGGDIALASTVKPTIRSLSAGVSGSGKAAGQLTIQPNIIANEVQSRIVGSTVKAAGSVTLDARDEAPSLIPEFLWSLLPTETSDEIQDIMDGTPFDLDVNILALSVSVAGSGTLAAGATGAINIIANTVRSEINSSTVTATAGDVALYAGSESRIIALTAGISGSGKWALDASGTLNTITNTIEAAIRNVSDVHAEGLVSLDAIDDSAISSVVFNIAASGTVALGLNGSGNIIASTVRSIINGSTVQSTSGDIILSALTDSDILAFAGGIAGSGKVAG
ncbi:MAG: hypothetical protein IFK94_16020, partial [Acidobacteria bacterium]|nr:hypothetical protein [Candidatus Polarisedimenticola svalbardensis]